MFPELKEIRERRDALGISQRQLAKRVGISQSNVAKIEGGKLNPSYSLAMHIFAVLDTESAVSLGHVSELASKPVVSIQRSDSVLQAIKILQTTGFKQIPVRDEEYWTGCVYERTIARLITETADPREILRIKVGSVMDNALPTVAEETPITTIIPLLQQTQAVLVARRGRVTGIVTNADLLKFIRPDSDIFVLKNRGRRATS